MPIALTDALWETICDINWKVNHSTAYKSDMELYGKPDFWEIANGAGDCEDYALAKVKALVGAGLDRKCLRLCVCKDENGDGHAVLTMDTDRGTYVLDNRSDVVKPWGDVPYTWLEREAPGQPVWVKVAT